MKASEIFPDKEERRQVKEIIDCFNGILVSVKDSDGKIIF
jgi:hypothetical protein